MGDVGWRTQISFLLAGLIFVLCHMIASGNRDSVGDPGAREAGDRSFPDGGLRGAGASGIETVGREDHAD